MQIPLLTHPRSIPPSRRHIPSITVSIYVSVTHFARMLGLQLDTTGPKDEKGIEGFESAFKDLGSCASFACPL